MTDDRRPTDDQRRPTDGRPPVRFHTRLQRSDRSPLIPFAALGLLVGIAVLSSRAAGPEAGGRLTPMPNAAADANTGGSPSPVPSLSLPDTAVAAICLEPGSWRTATIETWRDQTVRVWRAVDPAPASGPDDPAIPIIPAVGSRIASIGFCAPVVGPDRPTGPATIEAWRREPAAASDPGTAAATRLELRRLIPIGAASPFGALFGPPVEVDDGTGWPSGIVVFRYARSDDSSGPVAMWFGVEVVRTDSSGKEAVPPQPSAATTGPTPRR